MRVTTQLRTTTVSIDPSTLLSLNQDGHLELCEPSGRELRIGPFSPEQREQLLEDLEYQAAGEELAAAVAPGGGAAAVAPGGGAVAGG